MGTTLQNGVYLPNEGERNCYAGLKTNWEILDQKVADVTALQQAVAGALHREIVESLPTTDIDPNTIYMILSGTSATENVYNEYMYVNNAWELIGTSATDLANYYTKADVDGKLLLKANDADVVHKSGDETVGGVKTFNDGVRIYKSNSSENTPSIILRTSKVSRGSTTDGGDSQSIMFNDLRDSLLSSVRCTKVSNGTTQLRNIVNTTDTSNNIITCETQLNIAKNGDKSFVPSENSQVNLGSSSFGWKEVYAQSYYYGSNNIEFSTKFVTTDTDQTISGAKTFSDNLTIYNNDSSQSTKNLIISSSKIQVGDTSNSDTFGVRFNAGLSYVSQIMAFKDTNGTQNLQLAVRTKDSSNNLITSMIRLRLFTNGLSAFESDVDNLVSLGSSSNKFKDVQTYKVNNLEPSSLSLPSGNVSDVIDISSYLVNLDGTANTYVAPANGWISITMSNCSGIQAYINGLWGHQIVRPTTGSVRFLMPILKNLTVNILIFSGTIDNARFIPCQGNV